MMNRDIVVNEFEFHSHYYIHFETLRPLRKTSLPILPAMSWIVSLMVFYKDGFWH